ncbi:MAG: hypothetical protein ACR2J3_08405 [Aridibacter sp.]
MKNCLECGSEKIIKNAHVFDRGDGDGKHNFEVYIDESPDALIFKDRIYHSIRAEICGDCGFVHFFANHPKSLSDAYQRQ